MVDSKNSSREDASEPVPTEATTPGGGKGNRHSSNSEATSGALRHPIYPLLLAAFPVLNLARHNVPEIPFADWFMPLLLTVGLAAAFLLACTLILRDSYRAGVVTAVIVVFLMYYGQISEALPSISLIFPTVSLAGGFPLSMEIVRFDPPFFIWVGDRAAEFDLFFVPLWILAAAAILAASLRPRSGGNTRSRILNLAAIFLVALPSLGIARHSLPAAAAEPAWSPEIAETLSVTEPPRDIYYLIFDRYGSEAVLRDFFDFDNTEFRRELRKRGFFVASDSYSNYPQTTHSLASSLNFEFLDEVSDEIRKTGHVTPLWRRLENHRAGAMLRQAGYRYHHAGAWWFHTRNNRYADAVFRTWLANEFTGKLLDQTLMMRCVSLLIADSTALQNALAWVGYSRLARLRFKKKKFAWLEQLPEEPGPVFAFAHFLLPHNPYIVDRDGNFVSRTQELRRERRVNYLEQVRFANRAVLGLVDSILARSEVDPIIIIQADEGPYPDRFYNQQGGPTKWRQATADELRMKFGILNAFYLPDREALPLHAGVTPVNTFRIVFNTYFGTEFELLPDQSYIFSGNFHDFWNVTNVIRTGKQTDWMENVTLENDDQSLNSLQE